MTQPAKILIVDDEAAIRFFLTETLSKDGYQVFSAEDGETALKIIESHRFDVVLLDLRMKQVGGMQVLRELCVKAPDTAVIILTAHGSLETAVEALRQGAHDYLFKPCKTVELRESVRTALLKRGRMLRQRQLFAQLQQSLKTALDELNAERSDQVAAPPTLDDPFEDTERFLRLGGMIIDFVRHIVTLDGHLLELSPTEFNLVAYMVSKAPQVLSPQDLVREVQGYKSEEWEARELVRYHIFRIRRKIEAVTGRTDVIITVRGVGYTIQG